MLDHHELARFPDGEHLIISQPYSSAVDTFDEELAQWQGRQSQELPPETADVTGLGTTLKAAPC